MRLTANDTEINNVPAFAVVKSGITSKHQAK
jgi:hypothetical protein